MNSAHDLGGMQGFGPVNPETDEPVFHHDWERRVFAMALAMGMHGRWNLDESRHSRESLPPPVYLSLSYYGIWLEALIRQLINCGLITVAELEGQGGSFGAGSLRAKSRDEARAIVHKGGSARVDSAVDPRFREGERVRVRNVHPHGHTRMPRYVRGKTGQIRRDHGVFIFPDSHAHGLGNSPQHCYSVRFNAAELWGESAENSAVYLDLWDDYLVAE